MKQVSQAEVIAKKLHHGVHEVRKAAKKAETFELRKLVKRLKAARNNSAQGNAKGDDPAEMERQLEVLKHANHEQFGNTALRTKVLKDGMLSKNEDVKAAVEDKLPENSLVDSQEPGSSAAKVHARLLSSKIMADAVHAVVDTLKEVLNPALARVKVGNAEEESEEESEEEEVDEDEDDSPTVHSRKGKNTKPVHPNNDESGTEEAEVDDAGWESGTVDGGEAGEGAGWESGSIDDGDHIAVGNSPDESDEDSDDDSDEDSSSSAADESGLDYGPPPKKAKSSAKPVADGVSTFLPSLSVGYTRGDSDASDISDGEGAAADAPRKNRRGQRARRAIWEKKYGRNANHVKTQQQQNPRQHQHQKPGRPHGARDERGGAGSGKFPASTARPGRATLTGLSGARPTREPLPKGAPGNWRPGVERDGRRSGGGYIGSGTQGEREKPLHPSWEAKKKLKEKQNPGIVAAQGKKITFS
ncbi:hypothetical protein GSI_15235 [Ganoderma sinense ZZ0214-1]|uniref:Bud22 domain-containing protein n=1 Tax=Ganoderma sinense ZZ0214-1 TaxID=1077348 RepID=A0A2G8RM04_9APHY|nr:hypothetical protein GSI_15235 [Ganoderma sinense ZZ0214-1]